MTAAQPYIAVSRRPLDIEDYFSIARRHYGWIAGPTFAGLVVSTVIAFCLPNVYVAKAVMQIRPSQISETLVQSTVNQQLNERIQQMESNIVSRQSLVTLINDPRLNLYRDLRNKEPLEDVEDEMRQAIKIVINPEMAAQKGASIFTISFEYSTRKGAQDTVNALITRFIAESSNAQRDQQETLTEFFGDEVAQAKANLDKQTEALNKFRRDHEGRLPEQEGMNIAALTSLQTQVNGIDQDVSRLSNERLTVQTQLTYYENELKLNSSFAQEAADAPPIPTGTMARQNDDLVAVNRSIDQLGLELQRLREIYKPNYPDVKNAEANLKILQKKRDDLVAAQEKQQAEDAAKPKPAPKKASTFNAQAAQLKIEGDIAHLRSLLQINDTDRDARIKKRDQLNKEITDYRSRLAETSALEANYADLKRDYGAAADRYDKYQKQKDLTNQSAELISRRATEYLDQLDAPILPQKPTRPDRPLIVGAGFGLSLMLGFALAGLQEARDASLKNLKDVRAYTNLPVLCSIPLLENTLLVKRKRRITALAWSAAVIVGILAVSGALFYYSSVISNT